MSNDYTIPRTEDFAIPTIAYWMGVPISEMPREELEREFVAAHREIDRLNKEICDRSVAHINDLARLRLGR